jgi:hypothetical protein
MYKNSHKQGIDMHASTHTRPLHTKYNLNGLSLSPLISFKITTKCYLITYVVMLLDLKLIPHFVHYSVNVIHVYKKKIFFVVRTCRHSQKVLGKSVSVVASLWFTKIFLYENSYEFLGLIHSVFYQHLFCG